MITGIERFQENRTRLSDEEIEDRVQCLLNGFGRKFGLITRPPIPVERLAEDYLGLRCLSASLQEKGRNASLSLSFFDRLILIDRESTQNGMFSTVVAHGIGHWVLHRGDFLTLRLPIRHLPKPNGITCPHHTLNLHEDEAKRFAAALVVPGTLLRTEIRNSEATGHLRIHRLARTFMTTEAVIRERFETLGIPGDPARQQLQLQMTDSFCQATQTFPDEGDPYSDYVSSGNNTDRFMHSV